LPGAAVKTEIQNRRNSTIKRLWQLIFVIASAITVCAAQDVVSIIHGTVEKVDKGTKTVVVKTADGTEHTIKVTDQAVVHVTKEGFDGLKEGSEVVARCTVKGTEKTADVVGKVGKDGMRVTKGTITKIDKGTKTVVVKTAEGTEKTFEYTDDAAKDVGKAVGKGTEKGAKVTVYYTEETGKKIAHVFA
jgi:arginine repressor